MRSRKRGGEKKGTGKVFREEKKEEEQEKESRKGRRRRKKGARGVGKN